MTNPRDLMQELRAMAAEAGLPGRITAVDGDAADLRIVLEVDPALGTAIEDARQSLEAMARGMPGIKGVTVILTAERAAQPEGRRGVAPPEAIPGVRHVIAVASGKGGVGKSTLSVNLALGLADLGLKVGLLDADIYGPSLPRLLNVSGTPAITADKRMIPLQALGMPVMSLGFLVAPEKAAIWRGAMVQGALNQMLHQVAWGESGGDDGGLDVLVVDMPPGTGDAHLTLTQRVPLAGVVIVSTPQDLALIDAVKAIQMFRRVSVPILGLVENMSYFDCPNCQHRTELFSHGGAAAEAARLDVPFLGEIPLEMTIRETSDAGTPIVRTAPGSPQAERYRAIARRVREMLQGVIRVETKDLN